MSTEKKTEDMRKKFFSERKNGYDLIKTPERKKMEAYCEGYKRFLNTARTEREASEEETAEPGESAVEITEE